MKPGSVPSWGTAAASLVPCPTAVAIGTTSGVSRAATPASVRSRSAPRRSSLLTKTSVGIRSRRSVRIRTAVCGWTPSTAETTSTAPSSTPSTRSTSAMKSGWPGVSMRLTVVPPSVKETTADLIVMPRCFSSARESVSVLPRSTLPIVSITPAEYSSRSVRLVLPASMCARMPRLSEGTAGHVLKIGSHSCLGGHDGTAHDHCSSVGCDWPCDYSRAPLRAATAFRGGSHREPLFPRLPARR